ncbi:MAG: adenosine kinase [Spirochaetales bacterium]|nr:adenosine kinase [Spirochaetales bacterium]
MKKQFTLCGIGNPLMDFVTYTDHADIAALGSKPGISTLIDEKKADHILGGISTWSNMPGGSCANTLRGVAWLNNNEDRIQSVYSGAVGSDNVGEDYIRMMKRDFGIIPIMPMKNKRTGFSIVMVTPDYERTMFTCLGACEDFNEEDLDFNVLAKSDILHFTAYMWSTVNQKNAVEKAVDYCRKKKTRISFDLADPLMVKFHKDEFISWIPSHVDIIFGNRDEITGITGSDGDDASLALKAGAFADIVVMKVGKQGCVVSFGGKILHIPGIEVAAIDTVGAGDAFAAGFLYGVLSGRKIDEAAMIANALAASIVTVEGCNFMKCDRNAILKGCVR